MAPDPLAVSGKPRSGGRKQAMCRPERSFLPRLRLLAGASQGPGPSFGGTKPAGTLEKMDRGDDLFQLSCWRWRWLELRGIHSNLSELISFSAMSAYPRDLLASRHGGPSHPGLIHAVTSSQRRRSRSGSMTDAALTQARGQRPRRPTTVPRRHGPFSLPCTGRSTQRQRCSAACCSTARRSRPG